MLREFTLGLIMNKSMTQKGKNLCHLCNLWSAERLLRWKCVAAAVLCLCFANVSAQNVEVGGKSYEWFYLEGVNQYIKGNFDAAFDMMRHCVEEDPEASAAWYYLGKCYYIMRDTTNTQMALQRAAEIEPDNIRYVETLADYYADRNKLPEAIRQFERMAELKPGDLPTQMTLYKLYYFNGDFEKALEAIERIEGMDGPSEALSAAKRDLFEAMGQPEKSLEETLKIAEANPYDLNHRVRYGDALLQMERYDEAKAVFDGVLKEERDNAEAMISLLSYHEVMHDSIAADSMTMVVLRNQKVTWERKKQLIQTLVRINEQSDADSTRILHMFGQLMEDRDVTADMVMMYVSYLSFKNMDDSLITAACRKALAIEPEEHSARMQLAYMAWRDDDMSRVIELCEEGRHYLPEDIDFYHMEALAYYRKDDYGKSLETLEKARGTIKEDTDNGLAHDIYSLIGELQHRKGNHGKAYEAYETALRYKPDDISSMNNFAYYLSVDNIRLDEAEQMSKKTIIAEPENATYLDTYAWILFRLERYAEAMVYIEQAVKNEEESSKTILDHAGDICFKAGEVQKALDYWQRALELEPTNKLLKKKLKKRKYLEK